MDIFVWSAIYIYSPFNRNNIKEKIPFTILSKNNHFLGSLIRETFFRNKQKLKIKTIKSTWTFIIETFIYSDWVHFYFTLSLHNILEIFHCLLEREDQDEMKEIIFSPNFWLMSSISSKKLFIHKQLVQKCRIFQILLLLQVTYGTSVQTGFHTKLIFINFNKFLYYAILLRNTKLV